MDEIKKKYNVEAWNWKQNLISEKLKKSKEGGINFIYKKQIKPNNKE